MSDHKNSITYIKIIHTLFFLIFHGKGNIFKRKNCEMNFFVGGRNVLCWEHFVEACEMDILSKKKVLYVLRFSVPEINFSPFNVLN